MNTLLATLLSGSSTQFDYTYSLAVEVGMIEQADVDWDVLTGWQANTGGLRLGYQVSERIDLLASAHWGVQSDYSYGYYYDDYEVSSGSNMSGWDSEVRETVLQVGPKFSWNIKPWFAPYATAQALMIHNHLLMSDNGSFDEDSTTLIDASAMGFGGTAALGLELRTRPIAKKVQPFVYLESGSSAATPLTFALKGAAADGGDVNIGDLGYGGPYFRLGAGTKF